MHPWLEQESEHSWCPHHLVLSLFFSQHCIQIDSLQQACFLPWCRAGKCTTKWPGYWKVSSAFLFRRITRSGCPHAHLWWGLSYKVNLDMKEPQSRKKNKTKLPSNGDAVRRTDGTCTCNPPGKQAVRDRRVTIHTQREKATSKGPRDHGALWEESIHTSPFYFRASLHTDKTPI